MGRKSDRLHTQCASSVFLIRKANVDIDCSVLICFSSSRLQLVLFYRRRTRAIDTRSNSLHTCSFLVIKIGWLHIVAVESDGSSRSDEDVDRTSKEGEKILPSRADAVTVLRHGENEAKKRERETKKKQEKQEKQEKRNSFFLFLLLLLLLLLFFTPGRTTRAMQGEQGIEWKINVSILEKRERARRKMKADRERGGEEKGKSWKKQKKKKRNGTLIIQISLHTVRYSSSFQITCFRSNESKRTVNDS